MQVNSIAFSVIFTKNPFAGGDAFRQNDIALCSVRNRQRIRMFLHLDCQYYLGDRPCPFGRLCRECPHYMPMGPRWLIIKIGALGDVLRTACLLPGLAAQSEPPYVTWVTSPEAVPLVERMPGVHRVLPFTWENVLGLEIERFDTAICLDKEPGPCGLMARIQAGDKKGIGMTRYGTPEPLNDEMSYYFQLGIDDEEKFRLNTRSYPQLVYEALGMYYEGQRYELALTWADHAGANEILKALGVPKSTRCVGIVPGAGSRFANKAWPEASYLEVIRRLAIKHPELTFLLLGGPNETEQLARMAGSVSLPGRVFAAGGDRHLGVSAALIERCDVVAAADTLALHMAVALERRVVATFGPTCHQEIDLFGRGEKLVSTIGCSPCYRHTCDVSPNCQETITVKSVEEAFERQLTAAAGEKAS